MTTTKPAAKISFRDLLSHLRYDQACKLLGDHGKKLIAQGSKLHTIQRLFIDNAALQCGICTPGFLMATKALLDHEPNPTEPQIRLWLANNLCRCTGYDKIVRAVQIAAAELQETA